MKMSRRPRSRSSLSSSRRGRWLAVLALVVPMTLLVAPSASAADGPFNIDGVVPDAGATELEDPEGNVKELGPLNTNTTKIGVDPRRRRADPRVDEPERPGRPASGVARHPSARATKDWLYFAWERDASNGSGFIAYEFMKDPPPAACDYDTRASGRTSRTSATPGTTAGPGTS